MVKRITPEHFGPFGLPFRTTIIGRAASEPSTIDLKGVPTSVVDIRRGNRQQRILKVLVPETLAYEGVLERGVSVIVVGDFQAAEPILPPTWRDRRRQLGELVFTAEALRIR